MKAARGSLQPTWFHSYRALHPPSSPPPCFRTEASQNSLSLLSLSPLTLLKASQRALLQVKVGGRNTQTLWNSPCNLPSRQGLYLVLINPGKAVSGLCSRRSPSSDWKFASNHLPETSEAKKNNVDLQKYGDMIWADWAMEIWADPTRSSQSLSASPLVGPLKLQLSSQKCFLSYCFNMQFAWNMDCFMTVGRPEFLLKNIGF